MFFSAKFIKKHFTWMWRYGCPVNKLSLNSQSNSFTKLSVYLIVGVICIGIIFQQIYPRSYKEYKCKGTKPKSAEPPAFRRPPDTEVTQPPSPSVLHIFEKTAVCSDSDICSNVGRDIIRQGGNAVDSALGILACNGLVTMQSMGIGGGFIMNVFQAQLNKSFTIVAREMAPFKVQIVDFSKSGHSSNLQGPISIAVPGEVMGFSVAHKRFSSMPWKDIIHPTIKICEQGFQLSKHQWDSLFFNPRIRDDTFLRKMFVNKTSGEYYRVGSVVYPPPELCATYRYLSDNGPDDFYNGVLAKLIAMDLQDIGSTVSLKDLEEFQVDIVDSIKINIGENTLHLAPPVGSGVVVGLVLNILKGYDEFRTNIQDVTFVHRIVEALKFAFAKRWDLGDPEFNDIQEILANLSSSEWAEQLRLRINDEITFSDPDHYGGRFASVDEHGTGHISVLAPNGDAVSVTSTIHFYFGSAFMGKRTGILFNNAMGDFSIPGLENYFSLPSSPANFVQPRKRPMSSMAPTIVTDLQGNVKLVIGGAGGTKIISALAHILLRVLWLGEDIKQAIDAPRFHHQLEPNAFEYEYGILKSVIDGLENIGHKTLRYRERGSAFCGIMKNATAVYANVDFRKMGGVSGF